jgi:NAD(P)-dependent dehydrogenase (short-subunit alcohol dehydrogenase family)
MASNPADLDGWTFIVTGANSGIGRITAATLAGRGAQVFLGCRSPEKGELVAAPLRAAGANAEVLPLDLADLSSVRGAAAAFQARGLPLHGLINNAGVAGSRERFMISPEEGAHTTILCATAPELAGVSGRYYDRGRESTPSQVALDDALGAR